MPRMDGYQLASAIREEAGRRGLSRTPIVALTASALKGEAERCLAAGMDDYLAKPVGIATLGACLQRWLPHTAGRGAVGAEQGARIQSANNRQAVATEAGRGGPASTVCAPVVGSTRMTAPAPSSVTTIVPSGATARPLTLLTHVGSGCHRHAARLTLSTTVSIRPVAASMRRRSPRSAR